VGLGQEGTSYPIRGWPQGRWNYTEQHLLSEYYIALGREDKKGSAEGGSSDAAVPNENRELMGYLSWRKSFTVLNHEPNENLALQLDILKMEEKIELTRKLFLVGTLGGWGT
ncbi:hypothetical protein ACJX0J_012983, partial [Zea mays]